MEKQEILNFIEDKNIIANSNWYLHASRKDIEVIKNILEEGIKSASLKNKKGNNFNGKYYISLYKNSKESEDLSLCFKDYPKFIIQDITPFYADRKKFKFRRLFINTRIPLRTSEWNGEFQKYLYIEPSQIIALEYSLSQILSNSNAFNIKEKLIFLREIVLYMEKTNKQLPIYDLSSNKELNKNKILSLKL